MPESEPPHSRGNPLRLVLVGTLTGFMLVVVLELLYIAVGTNLREVIPGELYRCAQPRAGDLANYRRQYGIRTVLMLRGFSETDGWYQEEMRGAEEQGLSLEILTLSAGRLPAVPTMRQFVEILDQAERPILVHCQRGVDRTGLICTAYLLLRTNVSLAEARRQLSFRYLHINAGRTAAMGQFLDLYADWLREQNEEHRPELFRRWILTEYRVPQGSAQLQLRTPTSPEGILSVPLNRHQPVTVRVTNEACKDLRLSSGLLGGLYLRWHLFSSDRSRILKHGPGALREARLPFGASEDFRLFLPPLTSPGRYWLKVDLCDHVIGSFSLYGSDPLFVELDVR